MQRSAFAIFSSHSLLLIQPFITLHRYWDVFVRTTVTEVRTRYAGSVLGLLWMVVAPLLLMGIYAIIYLVIFNVRPTDMSPAVYVVHVLSGLLPFLGFSEALGTGTASLSMNRAILLSTVFPAELVPLRAVVSSQASTAVGMVFCVGLALLVAEPAAAWVLLPLIWIAMLLFVSGIVLALSLASLLLKDIQQVLGYVTMVLLIASPIGYTPSMVPASVRPWLLVNPLAHYINAIHDVLIFGRWPSPTAIVAILTMSVGSFALGFWIFGRSKRVFFDYA